MTRPLTGLRRRDGVTPALTASLNLESFRPSPRLICGACGRKSLAANFRFQSCYTAGYTGERTGRGSNANVKRSRQNHLANASRSYARAGVWSPSAHHWSGHAMGRSTRRLRPKPRGRRASTAALTMSGARKASDSVIRIERIVLPSREAIDSKVRRGSERSSSLATPQPLSPREERRLFAQLRRRADVGSRR